MHTYVHTYIPTYIHTYMHACMRTYMHIYIYIYVTLIFSTGWAMLTSAVPRPPAQVEDRVLPVPNPGISRRALFRAPRDSARRLSCRAMAASQNSVTRSHSNALLPFLFWGRVPLLKSTTEKKGTLILSSLLEDLGDLRVGRCFGFSVCNRTSNFFRYPVKKRRLYFCCLLDLNTPFGPANELHFSGWCLQEKLESPVDGHPSWAENQMSDLFARRNKPFQVLGNTLALWNHLLPSEYGSMDRPIGPLTGLMKDMLSMEKGARNRVSAAIPNVQAHPNQRHLGVFFVQGTPLKVWISFCFPLKHQQTGYSPKKTPTSFLCNLVIHKRAPLL